MAKAEMEISPERATLKGVSQITKKLVFRIIFTITCPSP